MILLELESDKSFQVHYLSNNKKYEINITKSSGQPSSNTCLPINNTGPLLGPSNGGYCEMRNSIWKF